MRPSSISSLILAAALGLLAACSSSSQDGKRPLGAECAGDNGLCLSGLCYSVDSATSVCSQTCASNDECGADMVCERVPVQGSICLPTGLGGRCLDDTECPAGHRCDTEASRCYIPVVRELCGPCTSSLQCGEGGHCALVETTGERYCTTPCEAGNCPAGFACETLAGVETPQCVPANEGKTCSAGKGLCSPCRGDSECGDFDDLCVRNLASGEQFCGESCQSDADCPSSFICEQLAPGQPKQCRPVSGTCENYCASDEPEYVRRQCGLGASCDVDASVCEEATDGRQCASCEDDDGCPSADGSSRCVVNNCADCPYKGQKFCADSCATPGGEKDETKCGPGFFCAGLGAGGMSGPWHCVPTSGTCRGGAGEMGDDCTALGAPACLSGICLGFGAQSVCSSACSSDGDCGDARFKCCAVTGEGGESFDCLQPPGELGGVCSPRGGTFGADCSPGMAPCFEGVCLDLGTTRICTNECGAGGSCREGFSCRNGQRPEGDGSFESIPVCFPDGGGSIGADCSFGPAACESGYCIKKPSGNVCTVTCADSPDICPAGWECVDEETVDGETVTICLPDDL